MKSGRKNVITFLMAVVVILAFIYVLLGLYYTEGFPCFTWINGVYATGKSVSEVNTELSKDFSYSGITVKDATGAELFIDASEIDLQADYTDSLTEYLGNTNSFAWGYNLIRNLRYECKPTIKYDRDKLVEAVSGWDIFKVSSDLKVYIDSTENGYVLVNPKDKVPNKDNIVSVVCDQVSELSEVCDISEITTCYQSIELTDSEKELVSFYDKIDKLQNCQIVYVIADEEIPVDAAVVSKWFVKEEDLEEALSEKKSKSSKGNPGNGLFIIRHQESYLPKEEELSSYQGFVTDSYGNLIISESKMYDFLLELSETYDTAWTLKRYQDGVASEIVINENGKGNGSIIDINTEFENLKTAFIEESYARVDTREITFSEDCLVVDAGTELGNTYIAVDMGEQMLYYYENGELRMNMPVVTGNVNRSRGTPAGLYSVYNKRYHTYLRGVDYVSYVNYWLGVHKGVGIHDATWRSKFGDEIYKSDGSHGCINCPMDQVSELWEIVEIGTPVILFY
ncbi:L,D-transpeptidase [Butyrivibrio proteoclasticus]|uniref:L,D-transpeptidase n=1 Tax=Butyrivibrio proteoclasticus TaxID=43305 RepID=UPI00047C300B|nr:L,D-transpeptidase [Butyrivibrio proteoclasticus]